MRWRCVWTVMLVAALGCERPAPEPQPRASGSVQSGSGTVRSTGPGSQPAVKQSATAAQPKPRPSKAKCVVPLPKEPARPTPEPAAECPPDPGRPVLPTAQLRFERTGASITAEIARTHPHRMRGLMYRTEMGEEEGMLFIFSRTKRNRFWMKNTCLPLDMLFVDKFGFIVGIEENVPVLNENNYFVSCDSQYVIEVNAGWSRRHGVKPGDWVELPQ